MIARLKKNSTKDTPKKKTASKKLEPPPQEITEDPKKKPTSSLHRMLTAEGWKRMTSK